MNKFKIMSIPTVEFAHSFEIDYYDYPMPLFDGVIEVVYLAEGELTFTSEAGTCIAHKGDVVTLCYREKILLESHAYHRHETVSMTVRYEPAERDEENAVTLPLVITDTSGRCHSLIQEIIRTNAMFPEQKLRCSGMCLELLCEISEEARRMAGSSKGSLHIVRAKKYIHRHIHEQIKQKEIAEYLGITPEYLSSLFRNYERCTVIAFINRVKLNEVVSLIRKEGIPLYKAAALYGFTNPHYVSRLFKKYFDTTVSEAVERAEQALSERFVWKDEEE